MNSRLLVCALAALGLSACLLHSHREPAAEAEGRGNGNPASTSGWWQDAENACPAGTALDAKLPPAEPDHTGHMHHDPWWGIPGGFTCSPLVTVALPVRAPAPSSRPQPPPAPEVLYHARCVRPDGTPHGRYITWYENGSAAASGEHTDGKLDGTVTLWYSTGTRASEAEYADGQRHGPAVAYHMGGKKAAQATFERDKHSGKCTQWHLSGDKAAQGNYANGRVAGAWRSWHVGGGAEAELTLDADGNGEATTWLPGGRRYSHTVYRTYKLHGVMEIAHDGKTVTETRNYDTGVLHGAWITRNPDGTVQSTKHYVRGNLVQTR